LNGIGKFDLRVSEVLKSDKELPRFRQETIKVDKALTALNEAYSALLERLSPVIGNRSAPQNECPVDPCPPVNSEFEAFISGTVTEIYRIAEALNDTCDRAVI
jgi:hypothetical protein